MSLILWLLLTPETLHKSYISFVIHSLKMFFVRPKCENKLSNCCTAFFFTSWFMKRLCFEDKVTEYKKDNTTSHFVAFLLVHTKLYLAQEYICSCHATFATKNQRFSSSLDKSWSPTVCNLRGNSLLGGNGVFPGMTILSPGQSMKSSTPAQRAWHLLANNRLPSELQTGTNIWLHFFCSHLSQDPLDGVSSLAQTASQRLG